MDVQHPSQLNKVQETFNVSTFKKKELWNAYFCKDKYGQ